MKSKSLILILLSFFSLSYATNFTQNYFEDQMFDEGFFKEFVSEFRSSIESCTENKIYIKPNSLKSTHLGMVLEQEGVVLHLPILHSDYNGSYIPLRSQAKPMDLIYCLCGWVKFEGDPCRNPDCPYK